MGNWLRKKLQNFVFKHLYHGVVDVDVMVYDNKKKLLVHNGKHLDYGTTQLIVAQAQQMHDMKALNVIFEDMKSLASKKVFEGSTPDETLAGKMMLHVVYTIQKKIYNIARLPIK